MVYNCWACVWKQIKSSERKKPWQPLSSCNVCWLSWVHHCWASPCFRKTFTQSQIIQYLLVEKLNISFQSECGKIRTRITPNTNTFYAMFGAIFGVVEIHILFRFTYFFSGIICFIILSANIIREDYFSWPQCWLFKNNLKFWSYNKSQLWRKLGFNETLCICIELYNAKSEQRFHE